MRDILLLSCPIAGKILQSIYLFATIAVISVVLNVQAAMAQDPCQCDEPCTTKYNYTNSTSNFLYNRVITGETVYIPTLGKDVSVEVQVCCRIRVAAYSTKYVSPTISASCETAIRCIRVAKDELLDQAEPGYPVNSALIRKELIQAVLALVMCKNRCEHDLPGVGAYPIEWVFSIPKCLDWTKTSTSSLFWCLKACEDSHTYCVYAYKMMKGAGGLPKPIERVVTTWTQPNESTTCPSGETCVTQPCDTDFRDCGNWDLSARTW